MLTYADAGGADRAAGDGSGSRGSGGQAEVGREAVYLLYLLSCYTSTNTDS